MARTFTHGLKARERYYGSGVWGRGWNVYPDNEWGHALRGSRPKRKRRKADMHWQVTPGWYHTLIHTRPWRRRVDRDIYRQLHAPVTHGWLEEVAEDDSYMPDYAGAAHGAYRKPHIYYW